MAKPKSVFITGANRGIGLDLVKKINERFRPQFLIATFRNKDQAKELHDYASGNENVHLIQMEVADDSKYPAIVAEVDKITDGKGLNLLINNAGILDHSSLSLESTTKKSLLQHFEVNTIAPLLITKAFFPLLEKAAAKGNSIDIGRAAVVNISTQMGSIDDNGSGSYYAYRTSKAALNMATKSLSIDLLPKGIMSVVIHPGWVQTDMGGSNATLTIDTSVQYIVNTLEGLNKSHNGAFLNYNGKPLPW